ncbi:MAG: TlpA family protein disulfide reductase, partial [Deltaproteobacteria bacterium]|nr:TlpA family protein disulfide reductase [Deltaproteobacteria bacterium]
MNRKYSSFSFNLIILIFIITFIVFPNEQEAKQLNKTPLDFSLKTLDGEEICLKSYRGEKIVHLLFWATWCPHCLMEMPKLKQLYDLVGNKPYEILAIDVGLNDSP